MSRIIRRIKVEERITKIEQRNKKVEEDKAWETSMTWRLFIALLTYVVVVLYTYTTTKVNNIFLSSLVPVIGFILSTLSLNCIRKIWSIYHEWINFIGLMCYNWNGDRMKELKINGIYRHFKGDYYIVMDVAVNTETEERMVIYRALYGDAKLYARPYDMFFSKVDKNKYPKVEQEYRFELQDIKSVKD